MNNIEILEKMLEREKECLHYDISQNEVQAIKNLIQENKELKNKCNELNFKYTAQWVDDNFIPKSKVKARITELEELLQSTIIKDSYKKEVETKIRELKGLLEEGE